MSSVPANQKPNKTVADFFMGFIPSHFPSTEEADIAGPSDLIMTRGNPDEEEEGDSDTDDIDHSGEERAEVLTVNRLRRQQFVKLSLCFQPRRRAKRPTPSETSWWTGRKWFKSGTKNVRRPKDRDLAVTGQGQAEGRTGAPGLSWGVILGDSLLSEHFLQDAIRLV